MKRLALTICLVLGCILVHAANGKSLFVSFNDGTRVEFALSDTPDVSFANDMMTVTATSTTASYELWTVTTFTYGTTTGISQTETGRMTIEGNHIVIDGSTNKVTAYSIDGKAAPVTATVAGDKTVVSLNTLPKGVYIIKINGKAIKITRR